MSYRRISVRVMQKWSAEENYEHEVRVDFGVESDATSWDVHEAIAEMLRRIEGKQEAGKGGGLSTAEMRALCEVEEKNKSGRL